MRPERRRRHRRADRARPAARERRAHETRLPHAGSPAVDRIPPAACAHAPLPESLEGEQHLHGLVGDRRAMLAKDQRGVARPQGGGCDAGALEVAR